MSSQPFRKMVILTFLLALKLITIWGHMVNSEIQNEMMVDNATIQNIFASDFQYNVALYPDNIDFGNSAVGSARSHVVSVVNMNENRSIHLLSIAGVKRDFYSSFFEDKIVPPNGNTTFTVVFVPRVEGTVHTTLMIHTSFGHLKLTVKGEGVTCPYGLNPLVGIKIPFNATIKPEIHMFNPHATPLQILEVYSSGGQFQLELPSGGQEAPQDLWQIPPFTTKPIIRIRFHATRTGYHSAYIRIKVNNMENLPDVLVVPVELEVLSSSGFYSENPLINFGRITSDNGIVSYKVNIVNSGNDQIEIVECKLNNVQNLIKLQESNFTLQLNPTEAKQHTVVNGELLIKMRKEQSKQYLELPVDIRAEIFKGSMDFQRNVTVFITGAKNFSKDARTFIVKNNFNFSIAINNITMEKEFENVFKVKNFSSKILAPSESSILFNISVLNLTANYKGSLKIYTNISIYDVECIVCTGHMEKIAIMDGTNLTVLSDNNNIIDFGSVPYGDFSNFGVVIIRNVNPIPIRLTEWSFTNPKHVYFQSIFLGCAKNFTVPKLNEKLFRHQFKFCVDILPDEIGAFELAIKSYHIKPSSGLLYILTEIQNITMPVKFTTVLGRLQADQSRLHFSDCFPGKRCSADISIHSTFLKPMRVKSITVSVPGLVFEYNTASSDGFPEILPNAKTDIGKIHFDPKSACEKQCYLPDGSAERSYTNDSHNFNTTELRKRTENFRRFKWSLQTITFTLDTTEVRKFKFNSTVDIVWPKLVKTRQVFSAIEVGHKYKGWIYIQNPSNVNVCVELSLSDPSKAKDTVLSLPLEVVEICHHCYLTDESVFTLGHDNVFDTTHVIKSNMELAVPILFTGKISGTFSTLLHIKNNLTMYEAVWITGKVVEPQFRFGNRKPGSQTPLLFEINGRHLANCELNDESREQNLVLAKRTFMVRNVGEIPISVNSFKIHDRNCEGYGFKIINCDAFDLQANSSKKIDIAFTPDFTMTRINRPLLVETNLSYRVEYTLLATVSANSIGHCAKSLHRPFWEVYMKKVSVCILTLAFVFVLIASFFETDKVLKDHIFNISKGTGPIQPLLDFRRIRVSNSTKQNGTPSNSSFTTDKTYKANNCASTKKRSTKRGCNSTSTSAAKDKCWAEELVKKLNVSSKNTERTTACSTNTCQKTGSKVCKTPPNSKNGKEDKPPIPGPKKQLRETPEPAIVEKSSADFIDREVYSKRNEFKNDEIQNELNKSKTCYKRPKPTTNASNCDQSYSDFFINDNSVGLDNQKNLKQSKEKYDSSEEKKVNSKELEFKHSSVGSETNYDNLHKPKSNFLQKTHGKTPGRERKKDVWQTKRTSQEKASSFQDPAFQFSSGVGNSNISTLAPNDTKPWSFNQASFSHIVAMNSSSDDGFLNTFQKEFSKLENNSTEHDWNEADLKNHETFGCDMDPTPSMMDLGPIGTKKQTTSWKQFTQPNTLMANENLSNTPQVTECNLLPPNCSVNSFCRNNNNHYLGYSTNLVDQIFPSRNPCPQWYSSDWPTNNYMWSPMGYQNESGVWNRTHVTHPPPGIIPKKESFHHKNIGRHGHTQDDPSVRQSKVNAQTNAAQPFDPFNTLSSIWSESWTKNEDNL